MNTAESLSRFIAFAKRHLVHTVFYRTVGTTEARKLEGGVMAMVPVVKVTLRCYSSIAKEIVEWHRTFDAAVEDDNALKVRLFIEGFNVCPDFTIEPADIEAAMKLD